MTAKIDRRFLAVLYAMMMLVSIRDYGQSPPAEFVAVWLHKTICAVGAVIWLVAALGNAVQWTLAWWSSR